MSKLAPLFSLLLCTLLSTGCATDELDGPTCDNGACDEGSRDRADAGPGDPNAPDAGESGICGDITAEGECFDDIATYCDEERGAVREVDCGALGQSCAIDPERGAICVQTSGCGDVTPRGECNNNVASFCDEQRDQVRSLNCSALDLTCVIDVERGAVCNDIGGL